MATADELRIRAINALRSCQLNSGDPERAHKVADDLICGLLESLGFADVVAEWDKVEKWYA